MGLKLIFMLTTFFIIAVGTADAEEKITIGGVEEVVLLPWGVKLPARIDTGAATSSLDARDLKVHDDMVEFKLPKRYGGLQLRLPVVMWHDVRGAAFKGRRPAIEVTICIGSKTLRVHVTLNDRSTVEYPLIMGRNVLQNNFVVDVSRAKTTRPNCPDDKSRREY